MTSRALYVDIKAPVGKVNNVNVSALSKRTKASYAAANDCVSTWTARTPASNNSWNSVCWAPELSLFVAVSYTGTGDGIMTSPDGINWTTRTSPANNQWVSVCWAPELTRFVAVSQTGTGNRVMTSSDGINWTLRTSAADNQWISVCWAPDLTLFVAIANSGIGNRVMTSPDGINWTLRTTPVDNNWNSVCWSPELSLFVAVAYSGTGNRIMTSPNGINWTIRQSPADNQWFSVCWSPELSLFVAVSNTGTGNRVMTSPDGINWTLQTSAADNNWSSVCWAPELSLFAAVAYSGTGNRIMTSPNGINWTIRTSAADNNWNCICWAPELSIFVAVSDTGTGNRVMTSAIGMPNAKSVVKALPSQMSVDSVGNVNINGNISAGNLGMFRNRIINGAMAINQRGAISSTTVGYQVVDRFQLTYNITTGVVTQSLNTLITTDTPYQYGFRNSYKITATTANTNYSWITPTQVIEGYNITDFNWGTTFGSSVTVSFWLRTNIPSNAIVPISIRNANAANSMWSYNAPVTVTAQNQWQYVSTTIPAPPNGSSWNLYSNAALELFIGGIQGGTASTSNTWLNQNVIGLTGALNIWATQNNFVEFTGVQLEKGIIATPFEFRPYGTELQLCQRYYQTFKSGLGLYCGDGNTYQVIFPFPVPMRAQPSMTSSSLLTQSGTYSTGWPKIFPYDNTGYYVELGMLSAQKATAWYQVRSDAEL